MPKGPRPNFFESDLVLALRLMSAGEVGRHKLAETLCLGEASGRSVLSRLTKLGLISSSRAGHRLTKAGKHYLGRQVFFTMPREMEAPDITLSEENMAFLVRGIFGRVKDGLSQRDRAIIGGASGATTLLFERGAFRFPGSGEAVGRGTNDALVEALSPRERDVVIIVSAATRSEAFRGCASVLEGIIAPPQ